MADPKLRVPLGKLEVVEEEAPISVSLDALDDTAPEPVADFKTTTTPADGLAASAKAAFIDTPLDAYAGLLQSAGGLVVGAGRLVQMVPGVTEGVDRLYGTPGLSERAMDAADAALTPANSTQATAKTVADVGQFFLPIPGAKTKAAVALKDAGLTFLQTGSPTTAGVSGALSAAMPGAAGVARVAGRLKEGAQKSVAQALGATKEWAKTDAAKLAPEMLERGVRGSRASMLQKATEAARVAGKEKGAAIKAATDAGTVINGQIVRGEIQLARDAFFTVGANGAAVPIAGSERVIRKLDKLDEFVEKLGDDIPVDKAEKVKQLWDRIVSKAGLYGPKATSSATDAADAWAVREGAGAFRRLLSEATPDLAALNKEYAFWAGLKNVLKETEKRTQAQGGGLLAGATASAGAASGFASGDTLSDSMAKAFVGAAAGRQFVKLMQSPYWRTAVSAPLKNKLADALASGSAGKIRSTTHAILKSLPAQVQQTFGMGRAQDALAGAQ